MTPQPDANIDPGVVRTALRDANLPALTMTLYQLTGDDLWLRDPFRPTRARGLDEHTEGGFDSATAETIREAALTAIVAWHQGKPIAVPEPDLSTLGEMLDCYLGQPVPPEYRPMFAVQHCFMPDPAEVGKLDVPQGFSVAIVGAGISGMLAAARLRAAGVPVQIFERNHDVGGVWLQNQYPGAGVDTPSNLYCYTDFPESWSTAFARRDEVLTYLRRYAEEHDLYRDIQFNTTVDACQWNEHDARWEITTTTLEHGAGTTAANALITAVGLFSEPALPELSGSHLFKGDVFHSAQWPDDYSVEGKRVAVVGSGASAMQIVPAIADQAKQLLILQRTPQWVAPVDNYFDRVSDEAHWLWSNVPYYRNWIRTRSAWNFNDKNYPSLITDPSWPDSGNSVNELNSKQRRFLLSHIGSKLTTRPDLLSKATPSYPPYAKRILLDNRWYDTLLKPTVQLECEGLQDFTKSGVRTSSGQEFDVDTVVLCTGFQTSRYLYPMRIVGRDGVELRELWGDDNPTAYLGLTTPGFPNLFFMYGPGTNPAGGSFIQIGEAQIRSIVQLLAELVRRGAKSVESRPEISAEYNSRMDIANAGMVWAHPGVTTYVRNSRGRVVVNMPWRVVDYWTMTASPNFDDYTFTTSSTDQRPEPT